MSNKETEKKVTQEEALPKDDYGLTGKQVYNIVSDIAVGVNVRKNDNINQAFIIAVFVLLGGGIAVLFFETHRSFSDPKRFILVFVGAFIGLIVGLLFSGIVLMLFRTVKHIMGKHD